MLVWLFILEENHLILTNFGVNRFLHLGDDTCAPYPNPLDNVVTTYNSVVLLLKTKTKIHGAVSNIDVYNELVIKVIKYLYYYPF